MSLIGSVQWLVLSALAVVVFAVQVVALIDGARRPERAYTSEGKRTRGFWLALLGIGAVIGFLGLPPMFLTSGSFLNVIALAPALIYWFDVRPAIKPYGTGGPRRPQGPRGPQW